MKEVIEYQIQRIEHLLMTTHNELINLRKLVQFEADIKKGKGRKNV